MMKYAAIFLVALLGVANASLQGDIAEIKALIPIDGIKALSIEYAANDAEFQMVVAYLRSDDFLAIVKAIHDTAEWQEFITYMDEAGVNMTGLIESINSLLHISSSTVRSSARPSVRSFHGWLDAVFELIPFSEIRQLIAEKRETSTEFQEFWGLLSGEKAQVIVSAVAATPEMQSLLTKGRDHGAPVDALIAILCDIFGWEL